MSGTMTVLNIEIELYVVCYIVHAFLYYVDMTRNRSEI